MMEYLDVIDEENNLTGEVADKSYIHKNGIWHREVACWIMNLNGEVLLQKRAITKEHAPGKWDLTAGHVKTNENPEDAMMRELEEEIGLDIKNCQVDLLMIVKRNGITTSNNVFQYQYFIYTDKNISEFIIEEEEVSEIKYITINELEKIIEQKDENYTFAKRAYMRKILEKLEEKYVDIKN